MTTNQQQNNKYQSIGNEPLSEHENTNRECSFSDGHISPQISDELFRKKVSKLYSPNSTNIGDDKKRHITNMDLRHKIIIGSDDRVKSIETEYPYRNIALLEIYDQNDIMYFGTGFFISKRCIITAGHCVYFQNNWAKRIKVIPGAKGNVEPFGSSVSKRFRSVSGWTDDGNTNYDHGAVILKDDNLYNSVNSYLGYEIPSSQKQIELSGYPADKFRTQWKSFGEISRSSKYRIYYELDTVRGNSGSPIYISKGSKRIVIGVHSFGQNPNYSIKLNQDIINRWTEWSNL